MSSQQTPSDELPEAVRTPLDAARDAYRDEGTGVHVFVIHDAVLAPFVSRALGIAHVLWPDFLAAAVVWPDGDALRIAFDGCHRTLVDCTLP
jgi:hypothetical protein